MKFIQNGTIYTVESDTPFVGNILIDGDKIVAVGTVEAPADAEVIDAAGKLVFPGFVDAHTHIGMHEQNIGTEGNDTNEKSDPVTPQVRAIDGFNTFDTALAEALAAGVTTASAGPGSANVVGGQFGVFKLAGHRADDMAIKFPSAMKIAFGENPKRVYGAKGKAPATRTGIAALLRETLFNAVEYKKEKEAAAAEGKRFKLDFRKEAWLPVLNHEIPLKAHAHQADDIFTALRIAREFDLDITLDHCTDGALIADDLAKENVPVLVGPSFSSRSKYELTHKSFKTPAALHNAGIKIAIITDHPVTPLCELPLMAGLAHKEGLSEAAALRAITLSPAEILGLADRIGSIAVGKDADIAIFDKNPITEIDAHCVCTLVNGQIVHKM